MSREIGENLITDYLCILIPLLSLKHVEVKILSRKTKGHPLPPCSRKNRGYPKNDNSFRKIKLPLSQHRPPNDIISILSQSSPAFSNLKPASIIFLNSLSFHDLIL